MKDKEIEKTKICSELNLSEDERIYFESSDNEMSVYEVVNYILSPRGFREFSENQFKRVAGGSKHSANLIKNYEEGYGRITNGYTFIDDILSFCQNRIENSVVVPKDKIKEIFKWSVKVVNQDSIPLRNRNSISAMMDITKGLISEEAFKIDCYKNGYNIDLNRKIYDDYGDTDMGRDLCLIKDNNGFREPNYDVQIKDSRYFLLVSEKEFNSLDKKADYYVGYESQWKKTSDQLIINSLCQEESELNDIFKSANINGIRVLRRGWAERKDFNRLPKNESHKGMSFSRNNNMFVYFDELRNMDYFFNRVMEKV